jgi:ABC-type cobalamin/Fe3+-siderophores transport system ATPase subunit
MAIDARLRKLVTNCQDDLVVPSAGVTCIVGGNNVGKSQLLRDVIALLERHDAITVVLSGLELDRQTFSLEEGEEWLRQTSIRQSEGGGMPDRYLPLVGGGAQIAAQGLWSAIHHGAPNTLGDARSFFCWLADAQGRVGLASGGGGMPMMGPIGSPLGRLYRDGDLEATLSQLSQSVFRRPLSLDRINGNLMLRVGKVDLPAPPLDHPTLEYADAIAALPPLDHQGDGVKSFIGIALHVMAGHQRIVLIDEPEAFLHPAQARALGRWLADATRSTNRQIILATHDRDIVLGLLQADSPVTIARLTREGNKSRIRQLAENDIVALWHDAVLRYSNVLEGLFHEVVVVCESDSDCRFYGAVLDGISADGASAIVADEVLFVPSGGKERVGKLAKAISTIGVHTIALVDFDALRNEPTIKDIVESVGGDWATVASMYRRVSNTLSENNNKLWATAKSHGLQALPPGDPTVDGHELLRLLRKQRVLVVPVGEMEGFERTVGGKSGTWVTGMLERGLHLTNSDARALLQHLVM